MKLLKLVILAMFITALAIPSLSEEEEGYDQEDESVYDYLNVDETIDEEDTSSPETEQRASLGRAGRFLAQKPRPAKMTCDKYPRVCRAKGSPGPDCCKKKCVDVMKDRLNCGMCGKKCKFSEICCKGKCVNPRSNKRHCGGCNNRCKRGNSCVYGMCSYA